MSNITWEQAREQLMIHDTFCREWLKRWWQTLDEVRAEAAQAEFPERWLLSSKLQEVDYWENVVAVLDEIAAESHWDSPQRVERWLRVKYQTLTRKIVEGHTLTKETRALAYLVDRIGHLWYNELRGCLHNEPSSSEEM